MTFKKTEKEIIKAIVKYGDEKNSMAQVINESRLLENRGIVIVSHGDRHLGKPQEPVPSMEKRQSAYRFPSKRKKRRERHDV